jgi:hypothetical protein
MTCDDILTQGKYSGDTDIYALEAPTFIQHVQRMNELLSEIPLYGVIDPFGLSLSPIAFLKLGPFQHVYIIENYRAAVHTVRNLVIMSPGRCPSSILTQNSKVPCFYKKYSKEETLVLKTTLESTLVAVDPHHLIKSGIVTRENAHSYSTFGRAVKSRSVEFEHIDGITQIPKIVNGKKIWVNVPYANARGFTEIGFYNIIHINLITSRIYKIYRSMAVKIAYKIFRVTTGQSVKRQDAKELRISRERFISDIHLALVRATTGPYTGNSLEDEKINDFFAVAFEDNLNIGDRDVRIVFQNIFSFLVVAVSQDIVHRGHCTVLPTTGGYGFMTKEKKFKTAPGIVPDWITSWTNSRYSMTIVMLIDRGLHPGLPLSDVIEIVCDVLIPLEFRPCTSLWNQQSIENRQPYLHIFDK